VDQRGRGVEALLHPPGELLGPLVRHVREVGQVEQVVDPVGPLRPGDAVRLAAEPEVLAGGQLLVDARLLGHVADRLPDGAGPLADVEPVDPDVAGRRRQQGDQRLDRRGLAGAVGAQEPEELPPRHPDVDPADGLRAVGVSHLDAPGVDRVAVVSRRACHGVGARSRGRDVPDTAAAGISTRLGDP
jgi:hypothetical protein